MSPTSKKKKTKRLFIISPIGEPKSEERDYFDKARRHIIDPVAAEKGYETARADKISKPGTITKHIIDRLRNDDLVVADLTRKNPNVFYELAVRHAVDKPVILMATNGEKIPFDVAAQRVIFYDLDPDNIAEAKEELRRQITAVESDTFIVDSPIEKPISLAHLEKSGDKEEEIIAILWNQSARLRHMEEILVEQQPDKRYQIPRPESPLRYRDVMNLAALSKDYDYVAYTLGREGYKLKPDNWKKACPKTTTETMYSFDDFAQVIRSADKKPEIYYDNNEMVLWFLHSKERGIVAWRPSLHVFLG